MDLNAFWALIERSAVETSGQDRRLEWLVAALSAPLSSSEAAGPAFSPARLSSSKDAGPSMPLASAAVPSSASSSEEVMASGALSSSARLTSEDAGSPLRLSLAAAPSPGSSFARPSPAAASAPTASSSERAVEFALCLDEVRRRVDTWAHWQAADVICGGLCSDDGFFYFQAWLIGQGRAVFESVALWPDALADLPHVQYLASRGGVHAWADDDWPAWEGLDYVAAEAFDGDLESVLASRGVQVLVSPEPEGERWDFADPAAMAARVPRLGALFGKVA